MFRRAQVQVPRAVPHLDDSTLSVNNCNDVGPVSLNRYRTDLTWSRTFGQFISRRYPTATRLNGIAIYLGATYV